jgi:GAF domain-containing protein
MAPSSPVDRRLTTLERLSAIEATDLRGALQQASQLLAEALDTEKVDTFLLDPTIATLVALGTSDTPLGRKQKSLGLDRVPLANGGSAARTFLTGEPYLCGDVQSDEREPIGVREQLRVQSCIAVEIVVGERRGVLQIASTQPDRFDEADLRFVETVARWLGVLIHSHRAGRARRPGGRLAGAQDRRGGDRHDPRARPAQPPSPRSTAGST